MDRRRIAAFGIIGASLAAVGVVLLLPVTIAPNPAAAATSKQAASTTTSFQTTTTTTPGEIRAYEFTGSFISSHCGSVIAPRHYRGLEPGVPIAESLTSEECRVERGRRLLYALVIGGGGLLTAAGLLIRRVRAAVFITPPIGGLMAALALVGVVHRL